MEAQVAPQVRLGVGSKVTFSRGMFGSWPGKIRKIYKGRAWHMRGQLMALVSYTRANGSFGRRVCYLKTLTPR